MIAGVFPTGVLAVGGDYRLAVIGIRQDLTYKVLDQAVLSDADGRVLRNLAQQDELALRVVAASASRSRCPRPARASPTATRSRRSKVQPCR